MANLNHSLMQFLLQLPVISASTGHPKAVNREVKTWMPQNGTNLKIKELRLHREARLDQWEGKPDWYGV